MVAIAFGLAGFFVHYVWYRIPQGHFGDFQHFYAAADAMSHGGDIYTVVAPGEKRAGYIYPPLIAFLYQPLVPLGKAGAARVSIFINTLALAGALALAAHAILRRFGQRARWSDVLTVAVLAALLSMDKIKGELQMLQTNALIVLGLSLGLWCMNRSAAAAGAALGFVMNIKYQALVLFPWLLVRRRWKAACWMIAGTLFWGFLPGVLVGFPREGHYLAQACDGILRLVGVDVGGPTANVEDIGSDFSVSITSAAVRAGRRFGWELNPLLVVAGIGLLWAGVIIVMYRLRRRPLVAWPAERAQQAAPFRSMFGLEWIALLATMLCFSPQTNMRHMVMTCLVNVLGVVVVIASRGRGRVIAVAALAILWTGLTMPPSFRTPAPKTAPPSAAVGAAGGAGATAAGPGGGAPVAGQVVATPPEGPTLTDRWHYAAGPTWSLLVATALIAWSALGVEGCAAEGSAAGVQNAGGGDQRKTTYAH